MTTPTLVPTPEQHAERLHRGYALMSRLSAQSRNPQDYD